MHSWTVVLLLKSCLPQKEILSKETSHGAHTDRTYVRPNLFYETEGILTNEGGELLSLSWIFEYCFDLIYFLYKTTTSRFQMILGQKVWIRNG